MAVPQNKVNNLFLFFFLLILKKVCTVLNRNKQTNKTFKNLHHQRRTHKFLPTAHVTTPEISPNRYRMYKEKGISDGIALSAQMKELYQQKHFLACKILSTVEMLTGKKCCKKKKKQAQKSHSELTFLHEQKFAVTPGSHF